MIANISEAKAHLSQLVERAYHGETVVIAKHGTPLADLVRHKPTGQRRLGLLAGQLDIGEEFFCEDKEINEMFYGRKNGEP